MTTDGRLAIGDRVANAGDRVLVMGPATLEMCALDATEVVILDLA